MASINWYKKLVKRHPAISFSIYFISLFCGLLGGIFIEIVTHVGKQIADESMVRPHLTHRISKVTSLNQEFLKRTLVFVEVENTGIRSGTFLCTLSAHEPDSIKKVTCQEFRLEPISPTDQNSSKIRISNLKPRKMIILRVEIETFYVYDENNKDVLDFYWENEK